MVALDRKQIVQNAKHLVVKVGTNVLTTAEGRLNAERIQRLVGELCAIHARGVYTTLVSSGAIGAGMGRLGLAERPKFSPTLQALAAIGQGALIQNYEEEFSKRGVVAAQVLLTASDLSSRERYLNIRNTFYTLFNYGAIPIVNENDAVSSAELSLTFGDNDRLAALVSCLFPEPLTILLTDVDGLYDGDPALPESKLVSKVDKWSPALMEMVAEKKSSRSKGGMSSKLKAARTVTSVGGTLLVANGDDPDILSKIFAGAEVGTLFLPSERLAARKRWFRQAPSCGTLVVDAGAARALLKQGKSLLTIGVVETRGTFRKGDVVSIVDLQGRELGRGLSNYSSQDAQLVCGKRSNELADALGQDRDVYEEIVHRDNFQITVVD